MVEACLQTGTHYLDLTGEMAEHEDLAAWDDEVKAVGVMLLPSAGFDVVPSDCLAVHVARRLPSATHLALAFSSAGGWSRWDDDFLCGSRCASGDRAQGRKGNAACGGVQIAEDRFRARAGELCDDPLGRRGDCVLLDEHPEYRNLHRTARGAATCAAGRRRRCAVRNKRTGPTPPQGLVGLLPAGPDDKSCGQGYAHLWAEASDEAGRRVRAVNAHTPLLHADRC